MGGKIFPAFSFSAPRLSFARHSRDATCSKMRERVLERSEREKERKKERERQTGTERTRGGGESRVFIMP